MVLLRLHVGLGEMDEVIFGWWEFSITVALTRGTNVVADVTQRWMDPLIQLQWIHWVHMDASILINPQSYSTLRH